MAASAPDQRPTFWSSFKQPAAVQADGSQSASSAFQRIGTPVETSAPLVPVANEMAEANSTPTLAEQSGPRQQTETQPTNASGQSLEARGEERQKLAQSSVYFLSSAADSKQEDEEAAANGSEQNKRQQTTTTLPPGAPNDSAKQQHSSHSTTTTASQSFDTPTASSRPAAKQGERVVSLQLGNGTTVSLIQDLGATQRPRPIYANRSDYQLLMLQMQQQQQQSGRNQAMPVHYHSNTDPVRRLLLAGSSTLAPSLTITLSTDLNQPAQVVATHQAQGLNGANEPIKADQAERHSETATTTTTQIPTTATENSSEIAHQSTAISQEQQRQAQESGAQAHTDAPQQVEQSAGGHVPGLAALLGTLVDSILPGGSAQPSPNEADQTGADLATGADGVEPSFVSALSHSVTDQHNDRRLGLDLDSVSFRQQQQQQQRPQLLGAINDSRLMPTATGLDELGETNDGGDAGGGQRCLGYCALNKFLHLCDSYHFSPDCAQDAKCCMSRGSQQQQFVQQQQQQQVCRGQCLPIYQASLCTKPSELLAAIGPWAEDPSSGACMPNQVCCSPPPLQSPDQEQPDEEASNHIDSNGAGEPTGVLQQAAARQHQAGGLIAALVPPPPPALLAGPSSMAEQVALQQQQAKTLGAGAQVHSPANIAQQQTTSGGLVNQILSIFKSSPSNGASGGSKQRLRNPGPPSASSIGNYQQQQLAMSATSPRAQQAIPPPSAPQLLVHSMNGGAAAAQQPAFMQQSPQVVVAYEQAQPSASMAHQRWAMVNANQARQPQLDGGQTMAWPAVQAQGGEQMSLLQRQMLQQYAAAMMAARQSQSSPHTSAQLPASTVHLHDQQQQQIAINYNNINNAQQQQHQQQAQQRPQVPVGVRQTHVRLPAIQQPKQQNVGQQDNYAQASASIASSLNRPRLQQQQHQVALEPWKQSGPVASDQVAPLQHSSGAFSPFSAADATRSQIHYADPNKIVPNQQQQQRAPFRNNQQQQQVSLAQQQQQQQRAGSAGAAAAGWQPQGSKQINKHKTGGMPEVADANVVAAGGGQSSAVWQVGGAGQQWPLVANVHRPPNHKAALANLDQHSASPAAGNKPVAAPIASSTASSTTRSPPPQATHELQQQQQQVAAATNLSPSTGGRWQPPNLLASTTTTTAAAAPVEISVSTEENADELASESDAPTSATGFVSEESDENGDDEADHTQVRPLRAGGGGSHSSNGLPTATADPGHWPSTGQAVPGEDEPPEAASTQAPSGGAEQQQQQPVVKNRGEQRLRPSGL